jgi:diadenylate cyclase
MINLFNFTLIKTISLDFGKLIFFITKIKPKDCLDILLAAIIFYLILDLFRKTKGFSVVIGFILIVALFSLSFWLQLILTYKILQTLFSAFIIILATIFQNEIRRFFEYIGILGIRKKIKSPQESFLDIITKTSFLMAKKKIGAIMIFPGKESIEQYAFGGKMLQGEISEELLLSLFDVHSPGHDGAIIIENGKITKFGVYLPLSRDLNQLEKYGTRHRAALGITEKTDCLCIVVSEEKGTVSVAFLGRIKVLQEENELKQELGKFLKIDISETSKKKISRILKMISNELGLFLLALVLSFSGWLFLNHSSAGTVQKNFILPVEIINIPNSVTIEGVKPIEVIGTFSGAENDFAFIEAGKLKIIIDANDITRIGTQKIKIDQENVRYDKDNKKLSSQISLIKLEPNYIQLTITKKEVEKK